MRLKIQQQPCLFCGKEVSRKPKKFCNNQCQAEWQYQQYISKWKAGEEKGWHCKDYQISAHIKRYLHEKYGSKCIKCGWGEKNAVTGKVPLQIHHINGDVSVCAEHNLELLCPNCHSLTPTFGSLNSNGKRQR